MLLRCCDAAILDAIEVIYYASILIEKMVWSLIWCDFIRDQISIRERVDVQLQEYKVALKTA